MINRRLVTVAGLVIAYLSIVGISSVAKLVFGKPLNDLQVLVREALIFLMAALLLWIIRQEKLPLSSIGWYPQKIGQSLLWSILAVCLCFCLLAGCIFIFNQVGWTFGNTKPSFKLSIWTTTLVVLRAGIVEELFFRGYIVERLKALTSSTYIAAFGSLIPFALFHYSQGITGISLAFVLGGALTLLYLWRRDLKSIMIAHFLIDFIPNVLGAL